MADLSKIKHGKGGSDSVNAVLSEVDARLDKTEVGNFQFETFTVATLPNAATPSNARRVVFVSNGNAGQPCLAVSNGTNWLRIVFGAAVAAV